MPLALDDPNYYARLYNAVEGGGRIRILDSTLREGEQHAGISFTNRRRLQIAKMLDSFGVDQIEISPIVSEDHYEATKALVEMELRADIVAHVRAIPSDVDQGIRCGASWVAVYMSVSDIQLTEKLRITREQAHSRAVEVADYIKAHGLKARFTMEDASRADPEFLVKMCKEMSDRGIDRIGIPDTVGTMRPRGMYNLVKRAHDAIDSSKTSLDVHCHNDLGLGLANALAGCEAGADQIHTTIDGVGERVGIPALAETAVAVALLYEANRELKLPMLKALSRTLSEITGVPASESRPIVGDNAFKHKAGTHLAAILKNPSTYEILEPTAVGSRRRIVFGELSGKTGISYLLSTLGLENDAPDVEALLRALKKLRKGDVVELHLNDHEKP